MKAEGYVEKIIYRNERTGYAVLSLSAHKGKEITCVGVLPGVEEGVYLEAEGEKRTHPQYGEQIKVETFSLEQPKEEAAMERYLSSGAIKGIGPALAARIVALFGTETFHVMEEEPERLAQVYGISLRMAREFGVRFAEKQDLRTAMMFLQQYGISNQMAIKIYERYQDEMYQIVLQNPYRLADELHGVGFVTADAIAGRVGIEPESETRLQAGILYELRSASGNGHMYLPEEILFSKAEELLHVDRELLEKAEMDLILSRELIRTPMPEGTAVYLSHFYYQECKIAGKLLDLSVEEEVDRKKAFQRISEIEKQNGMVLEETQREAVLLAAYHGVLVVTGGPGTGKTTIIRAMIQYFEEENRALELAAPTGRAAKRMSEATGRRAQTIHRLLEMTGGIIQEGSGPTVQHFERNEDNPLEADVVIIDEVSMVDAPLMMALLRAIVPGTKLILVGDADQLPSVGPGNVLKDILNSSLFPTVRLDKIFRQSAKSDIILNAHKINHGELLPLDNHSKDFFFLRRQDVKSVVETVKTLMTEKLPRYVKASVREIQVLTPMRKGELGVEALNRELQSFLNPPGKNKPERTVGSSVFRLGDKVMQIKNNYQLSWDVRTPKGVSVAQGMGVFNGDMGFIKEINMYAETLTVEFDDGREVVYPFAFLEELELAYAVTIHKSQGSEYPAVIIPLLSGPKLLFYRNILYTAVTRAKQCVVLVGSKEKINEMILNVGEQVRYSGLAVRLAEYSGKESSPIAHHDTRAENF